MWVKMEPKTLLIENFLYELDCSLAYTRGGHRAKSGAGYLAILFETEAWSGMYIMKKSRVWSGFEFSILAPIFLKYGIF